MKHILIIITLGLTFIFQTAHAAEESLKAGVLTVRADRVKHNVDPGSNFKQFIRDARELLAKDLSPEEVTDVNRAIEHLFITLGQPRLNPVAEKFFGTDPQWAKDELADFKAELDKKLKTKTVKK